MAGIIENLDRLGIVLPDAPKPVASYVPARRAGNLLFISGQVPIRDGTLTCCGAVPSEVSLEEAREGARLSAINALAVARDAVDGDLDRIEGVVRLGVFVASDPTFTDQPQVANGASDLMVELLGDAGKHARAAVGSVSLPLGVSVEVEMILQIKS